MVAAGAPLRAADKYKADDEIEVLFLGKWLPAKLVDQNRRGDVMAEFEFAATTKRQTFRANEVRLAFEAGAIAPARFWSDASGSFKVRAALLSVTLKGRAEGSRVQQLVRELLGS